MDPKVRSDKLTFLKKDIRDHSLIDFWKEQKLDTMVHLAFIVNPIHDEKRMYDVNVNGTLNILRICEELKPKYTSEETIRIMFETHGYKLV